MTRRMLLDLKELAQGRAVHFECSCRSRESLPAQDAFDMFVLCELVLMFDEVVGQQLTLTVAAKRPTV